MCFTIDVICASPMARPLTGAMIVLPVRQAQLLAALISMLGRTITCGCCILQNTVRATTTSIGMRFDFRCCPFVKTKSIFRGYQGFGYGGHPALLLLFSYCSSRTRFTDMWVHRQCDGVVCNEESANQLWHWLWCGNAKLLHCALRFLLVTSQTRLLLIKGAN